MDVRIYNILELFPHAQVPGTPSMCQSLESGLDEADAHVDTKAKKSETLCTYISLVSRHRLLLNVTPQAVSVMSNALHVSTYHNLLLNS